MVTEEQVLEIETYCRDNNVSRASRLESLGIKANQYYWAKRKMLSESADLSSGKFLQLSPDGEFRQTIMPGRKKSSKNASGSSYITIEFRNGQGSAMRIQGELGPEQLREIMSIM